MTPRKYLVLACVAIFNSIGDALLARGMKSFPAVDIHHVGTLFRAVANPYIILGIFCLLAFMACYMTALSFADLTYVLPANAVSYILMTLLSIFWLHEHVSPGRWLGILLICIGVGAIAAGPARTVHPSAAEAATAGEPR